MAARIYALAKELNIDSKILVELCQKAGVTGKGSALASLTDEEVVKVKAYVAGGGAKAARADAPARPEPIKATAGVTVGIPVQSPVPVVKGPVPVMAPPPRTSRAPAARATSPIQVRPGAGGTPPAVDAADSPEAVEPVAEQAVQDTPETVVPAATAPVEVPAVDAEALAPVAEASAPVAPVAKSPAPPASKRPAEPAPMRREDYMAPGGTSGKPIITSRPAADRRRPTAEGQRPPVQRSGPSIRLGQMPASAQPKAAPKSDEPAPQKPDIRLPADAIRASRAGGGKPLQEHLRKHEAKRKADAAGPKPPGVAKGGKPVPRGPAVPETPEDLAARLARERSRRGKAPVVGDDKTAAGLGGREARQLSRKRVGGGKRRGGEGEEGGYRRPRMRMRRVGTNTAAPRKGKVVMEFPTTVRNFSEGLGVPVAKVLSKLLAMGTMSNINTHISAETGEFLAMELGVEMDVRQPLSLEEQLMQSVAVTEEDDAADMQPRPPIVTFLGHVDHGKTSLLDRLIGISVVSGESGGITQHIRAYSIDKDGRKIAFVDTPGHEAFTEMRARGANVTDIAVLVIAADDGVMPQTEEAISHARAAGVPIVVALNKMDLPGINLDRIYQQLATSELLPTEWGGDTEVVKVSAMTGLGMDELLETLLTIADLHDYKANPNRKASGTCLEAELHEGRGVVVKLMVQTGTLKVGDVVVCGGAHGRVKAMYDTLKPSRTYKQAGPSMPVNVTGLDVTPNAGDHFYIMDDIAQARDLAAQRSENSRQATLGGITSHVTLETLHDKLVKDETQTLNLILRADVRGSIEAILKELTKLDHPEVQVKILQATVGGITEADVQLADASDAVIIGFNVVPDEGARSLAEQRGVQVRRYEIIYQVTTDLREALEGMLRPEKREVELGRALVKRTFVISRLGTIAGCQVLVGTIERNCRMRVIRDSRVIGDYALDSLKREKDDAREVRVGFECGLRLAGFNDLKEGDILEGYRIEEVARTF